MTPDRLRTLLQRVARSTVPATRAGSAKTLSKQDTLPESATATLVQALEDFEALEHEEWIDWDGSVVGGEDNWGPHFAAVALGKVGAPALPAVLKAVDKGALGARWFLPQVTGTVGAEALLVLGPEGRGALTQLLAEAVDPDIPLPESLTALFRAARRKKLYGVAGECLAWAKEEAEGEGGWSKVIGRLRHPRGEDQRAAALELRACPDTRHAAASLVDALVLDGGMNSFAQNEAAITLASFGDVLDDRRLAALIERASEHEPFYGLAGVMRCLGAYGKRAVELGARQALQAWTLDKAPRRAGREWHEEIRLAASWALRALND